MRRTLETVPTVDPTATDVEIAWGDDSTYQDRTQEVAARTYSARTSFISGDQAYQLMGYDPNRSKAQVTFLGQSATVLLLIGTFPDVSQSSGYTLSDTFGPFSTETQEAIYARVVNADLTPYNGAPVPVSLWIESNR